MTMKTQMALAKYFQVSSSTVAEWVSRGPFVKDKKTNRIDLYNFVRTLVKWQSAKLAGRAGPAGGLDLSGERAKLAQKQTEALEFKNALAKGEYVKISVVADQFEARIVNARERLLSSINVIAAAVQSREHPIAECEVIVRDRIYEVLNELASEAEIDGDDDEAEAEVA